MAMGFFVNIPVALAPGMGLNAYFMTVVLSSNGAITWQAALGAVFISGIVFIILTVTKVRQIADCSSEQLKDCYYRRYRFVHYHRRS